MEELSDEETGFNKMWREGWLLNIERGGTAWRVNIRSETQGKEQQLTRL